jgi:hypothetical protein
MAVEPYCIPLEPIPPLPVEVPGSPPPEPRTWLDLTGTPCLPPLEGGLCGCDEPRDDEMPADCRRARCDC